MMEFAPELRDELSWREKTYERNDEHWRPDESEDGFGHTESTISRDSHGATI